MYQHLLGGPVVARGRALVAELERESPLYGAILHGRVDRAGYVAFLVQHHKYIRLTHRLMSRYAAAMAESPHPHYRTILHSGAANHAAEEEGHEDGILADLASLWGCTMHEALVRVDALETAPPVVLYDALVEATLAQFPAAIAGLAAVLECVGESLSARARDALLAHRPFPGVERAVRFFDEHAEDGDHVEGGRMRLDLLVPGRDTSATRTLADMTAVFYRELFRTLDDERARQVPRALEASA